MTITGTIPSSIANYMKSEDKNLNGIKVSGNDIDIVFTDKGSYTSIYAIGIGNNGFEIQEIDDNLNLFPDYDVGDVISFDVLKKSVLTSGLILSWNPLGKAKYGILDTGKAIKKAAEKVVDKAKGVGRFFADIITPEEAQAWIRKNKGFERAKVGDKIQRVGGVTGGYYVVLAGNPADKTYSVWKIYRNGNEFRTLTADIGLEAQEALNVYDEWCGNQKKETEEIEQTEEPEENNVQEGEAVKTDDNKGDIYYDISDVDVKDISAAFKKHKSKYNGKNVTGYEDGMLGNIVGEATTM